MKYYQIFKHWH